MLRIDMLGPPGAGKTTLKVRLLRDLLARGLESWDQRAIPLAMVSSRLSDTVVARAVVSDYRIIRSVALGLAGALRRRTVVSELMRIENEECEWLDFASTALRLYVDAGSASPQALRRVSLLIDSLCEAHAAELREVGDVVICDEGLAQRAISLALLGACDEKVWQYLHSMPRPGALVVLDESPETIRARLERRDGIDSEFCAAIERAQVITEMGRVWAESVGIRVIRFHVTNDPYGELLEDVVRLARGDGPEAR